jgi:hypothetical protein
LGEVAIHKGGGRELVVFTVFSSNAIALMARFAVVGRLSCDTAGCFWLEAFNVHEVKHLTMPMRATGDRILR